MKRVLFTVGSTFFDELVDSALSDIVLEALHSRGAEEITVQCGAYKGKNKELAGISSTPVLSWNEEHGLQLEIYAFKPNLTEEFMRADLVVSHAGSGTIIDVLRLGKPLIVVPNPSLLDNHQQDLATELEKLGYLKATTPRSLHDCISKFEAKELIPFPQKDKGKFQAILDEMMGFD
ncbi:glycosyltransferase family 1 protein [Schizopora paradoxa]|uniref:UDP-N-acetylglucosamine transferase subunit ALG13 n=1 Tax=Schizopora paradoxa TaxID=27342 RepID=A0A0H2SA48_9AGAM|nr:glycosyltransferase family 1 protein [Schizopora paradoxa]